MRLRFGFVLKAVLSFGFVLKAVLIIQRYFCDSWEALAEPRPFLLLIQPHHWEGWEFTRKWEVIQLGKLIPTDQSDILHHMVLCSVCKPGERRSGGKRGAFRVPFKGWKGILLSCIWVNTPLLMGNCKWIPYLSLFVCSAFAQPMSFLTFTLLILPSFPP